MGYSKIKVVPVEVVPVELTSVEVERLGFAAALSVDDLQKKIQKAPLDLHSWRAILNEASRMIELLSSIGISK